MLEFSPSFPLEELKERVNNGYYDEEVYTYLYEILKEESNDSKELKTGEISPYDFFTLTISERDKGWRSHYISSTDHGTVDKEIITLLKNRIDMLFEKAKSDLGINKEAALEVPFQEQQSNSNISKEKLQWMQEVGMREFEEPMKYYINGNSFYSEKYIKYTPLAELKMKCARTMYTNKLKHKLDYKTFKFFYIVKKFFKVIFKSVFHVNNSRCR